MVKYKKKDILRIIDNLTEMNRTVVQPENVSLPEAVRLLTDGQEAAIALGTYLETWGGKYSHFVKLLEDYCENIYQMSLCISKGAERDVLAAAIREQLGALRDGICSEYPPDRKEVVFLPYKASMWDSMESVWRAADEDPACDVYVVPIPYYDKAPDGSRGAEHYEGDLYPQDVPVTDYRFYDLRSRRPDMIFIHNPYDQYNFVTTLHPDYYAKVLKQYTETLVYIPYFVHQNDRVKEEYCVLPGTIYADVVILQSEKVKEQYIKYYEEAVGNGNGKFVALGSPKFEVKRKKTEISRLPDEWQRLISHGKEKKKVIFLNTHHVNLMQKYSDRFFLKIERIFTEFKNKENIILLWRPHPLSWETAKSMNPGVAEKYRQLVEKYKEEAWGIYDDTTDLHRAIMISDAYYGNYSSVAELFRQAGKPVMIMDLEV